MGSGVFAGAFALDHALTQKDIDRISVGDELRRIGYRHMDIVSGTGHDACYVARVAPTATIFIPCESGISHNEIENTEPEHIEAGANVLLGAVLDGACVQNSSKGGP
jgi:N-carbamoyl-L-amino-acid hydrolase